MKTPKYRRGWYVTNIRNGMKGKIEDVYPTPTGFEYTLLMSGTTSTRLSFPEAQLMREGNQSAYVAKNNKFK